MRRTEDNSAAILSDHNPERSSSAPFPRPFRGPSHQARALTLRVLPPLYFLSICNPTQVLEGASTQIEAEGHGGGGAPVLSAAALAAAAADEKARAGEDD